MTEVTLIIKEPPFDNKLDKMLRECTGRTNIKYSTFNEVYSNYVRRCKKKFETTPEMFSLLFDAFLIPD